MIIAVTGGIGSGKSTLLKIFNDLGYVTLSADAIYADLLRNNQFVELVSETVGVKPKKEGSVLTLDREKISEKVFADKSVLNKLDELTHTAIMEEMFRRAKNSSGIVFCEVPLLFECGYQKSFDQVIVVSRELSVRVDAVTKRDGKTVEKVKNIIKNQFDYSKIGNDEHTIIVENDGDESALRLSAEKILAEFNN